MKVFLFTVTALLTLANLSTAARAFSSNPSVVAKVPFNFTVGHDQLPSGTYKISRDPSGLITIQNMDRQLNVLVATTVEPVSMVGNKLVFHRYGDQYFLSKISSSVFSVHVPVSKLEKRVRHQEAQPAGEYHGSMAAR
jgi:hypothetical protein